MFLLLIGLSEVMLVFRGALLLFVLLAGATASPHPPTRNFDDFGDINCEDEMARLDNLAINLQNVPHAKAAMIFYGGQRFRGRLPKRGEAAVRAARMKTYLVNRRGIKPEQIQLIDGGFREEWWVQIWIVPPGANLPSAFPTVSLKEIKFRKGKATPRDFRCNI